MQRGNTPQQNVDPWLARSTPLPSYRGEEPLDRATRTPTNYEIHRPLSQRIYLGRLCSSVRARGAHTPWRCLYPETGRLSQSRTLLVGTVCAEKALSLAHSIAVEWNALRRSEGDDG